MSAAVLKFRNAIFIALLVISNTFGNLFVALGMNAMPEFRLH